MRSQTTVALLCAALALPPAAGAGEEKRCTEETSACVRQMADYLRNKPWIGVELDHHQDGKSVVKEVFQESPAAAAGVRTGDALVALNGVAYENEPGIKDLYKSLKAGDRVTLTVLREGKKVDVPVQLGHVPPHLIAQWIGQHVLEDHVDAPPEVARQP